MGNLRGIFLMVASMAAFAVEDMLIKQVSVRLPVGQILITVGFFGMLAFWAAAARRRRRIWSRDLLLRPVLLRNLGEMIAALGFITALSLTPLSSASAILQATPLAVTLGAALFLGERVGWRRWSAIAVGFAGVLMIVRPGLTGFQPASLFAVGGVIGLAMRDVATRRCPPSVSSLQLSAYGFGALVPAGALLMALTGGPQPVGWTDAGLLSVGLVFGIGGYYAIVEAMRAADVGAVMPFRYTRLLFALGFGMLVFGERPDQWTLGGAALIVGSGLYTIARERALFRRRKGR